VGAASPSREVKWLCKVCANSSAGNAFLYPDVHATDREVLQTLCWGINYLASLINQPGAVDTEAI
jgi:hypothetical protein